MLISVAILWSEWLGDFLMRQAYLCSRRKGCGTAWHCSPMIANPTAEFSCNEQLDRA